MFVRQHHGNAGRRPIEDLTTGIEGKHAFYSCANFRIGTFQQSRSLVGLLPRRMVKIFDLTPMLRCHVLKLQQKKIRG
jgi:hypothetical protein